MLKPIPPALAIAVAAAGIGYAKAGDLEGYVGKYPFGDKVGGRTLYQTSELKRDFRAKFGKQRWSTLLGYHTSVPVESVADPTLGKVIVASQCKPHDCPTNAVVFLAPDATVLGACFARETGRGMDTKAEWLGPGWRVEIDQRDCGRDAKDMIERFKAAAARR